MTGLIDSECLEILQDLSAETVYVTFTWISY